MALIFSNQTYQGGEEMAVGYFDDTEMQKGTTRSGRKCYLDLRNNP
jgi:hypothetical protein